MRITLCLALAASVALAAYNSNAGESKNSEPVGWRGNWTGRFLDANPPVTWSKLSKPMKGLRCQADKPKDEKPAGVSASLGSLTEWLVLGPLTATSEPKASIDEEFIKDEA